MEQLQRTLMAEAQKGDIATGTHVHTVSDGRGAASKEAHGRGVRALRAAIAEPKRALRCRGSCRPSSRPRPRLWKPFARRARNLPKSSKASL